MDNGAIGMGHAEICADDRVCLLEELDNPIVLREVRGIGNTYQVVGGIFLSTSKLDGSQASEKVPQRLYLC
jgi:hypothetical protein